MPESNTNKELESIKIKINMFERRWRDIKIFSLALGVGLIAFLGLSWASIPGKIKEEMKNTITEEMKDMAERAATAAQEYAAKAKKALESAEQNYQLSSSIPELRKKMKSFDESLQQEALKTDKHVNDKLSEINIRFSDLSERTTAGIKAVETNLRTLISNNQEGFQTTKSVASSVRKALSDFKDSLIMKSVQFGTSEIGRGEGEMVTGNIEFKRPFDKEPHVIVTPRGANVQDTFSVTTREIRIDGFEINIWRTDGKKGVNWQQDLRIDWIAFN